MWLVPSRVMTKAAECSISFSLPSFDTLGSQQGLSPHTCEISCHIIISSLEIDLVNRHTDIGNDQL